MDIICQEFRKSKQEEIWVVDFLSTYLNNIQWLINDSTLKWKECTNLSANPTTQIKGSTNYGPAGEEAQLRKIKEKIKLGPIRRKLKELNFNPIN
jgi:hypothetical protein